MNLFSVPEFCSSKTFIDTMGISKANELLLLGQKIDAKRAVEFNICSKIMDCNNTSNNPFCESSIGNKVCQMIDDQLLSLPLADKSSKVS